MSKRACGSCTACCEGWLPATINGAKLTAGVGCKDLCATGCGIYPDRPEIPCQSFKCGWLQDDSPLPEHMRPDQSGVIVLLDRTWRNGKIIRAIPVGDQIPTESLEWLKNYAQKTATPMIFRQNHKQNGVYTSATQQGYGPPAFVHAVKYQPGEDDIFRPEGEPPG